MRHFRLLPLFLALPALAQGAVEGFGESFDGTGPFESIDGKFQGLDVSGWSIDGDGQLESGAYVVENDCECVEGGEWDILSREVIGSGSFSSRVEIRDVDLRDVDTGDPATSLGQIRLSQMFPPGVELGLMDDVTVQEPGHWLLFAGVGENIETAVFVPGQIISLSVVFDDAVSEVTLTYDPNIDDGSAGFSLGPFAVQGRMPETWTTRLAFSAGGTGNANGRLDLWYLVPLETIPGDFNGNGTLDVGDIDLLSEAERAPTFDANFDLNEDGKLDHEDRTVWLHALRRTWYGDANLDDEFNSSDIVSVLASGEYDDDVVGNSTWRTGDWDGDGEFTSRDFVVGFADGGYEFGPRAEIVPEPASIQLATVAAVFIATRRRRCLKTRRA